MCVCVCVCACDVIALASCGFLSRGALRADAARRAAARRGEGSLSRARRHPATWRLLLSHPEGAPPLRILRAFATVGDELGSRRPSPHARHVTSAGERRHCGSSVRRDGYSVQWSRLPFLSRPRRLYQARAPSLRIIGAARRLLCAVVATPDPDTTRHLARRAPSRILWAALAKHVAHREAAAKGHDALGAPAQARAQHMIIIAMSSRALRASGVCFGFGFWFLVFGLVLIDSRLVARGERAPDATTRRDDATRPLLATRRRPQARILSSLF